MSRTLYAKYQEYKRQQYLLLYFECDGTYDILCSNSTLLPPKFDADKVNIKDVISIKPDLTGVLIAKSNFEKDMEIYKRRLDKRLDRSDACFNVQESFSFLEKSSTSTFTVIDSQSENEEWSVDTAEEEKVTDKETESNNFLAKDVEAIGDSTSENCNLVFRVEKLTNAVVSNNETLEKIMKTQKSLLKEVKSLREKKKVEKKVSIPTDVDPVLYKNKNLVTMGHNNMIPSTYGGVIGRFLFSDDELSSQMLFPVRDTGRRALSPTRSNLFKKAVLSRFDNCDDAVRESVSALNQLGNDIKRGRRKRKND